MNDIGIQETYSVSEIKRLCAMSEYLNEDDIREGDRGVSWDGSIVLYQDKKSKAAGKEIQIPIQIKGKTVSRLSKKDTVAYPIKVRDLRNYFNNGGIILFVVEIEKQTFHVKPYAKVLLPLDLKKILFGKEKQNEISVHLHHLESHLELEKLCGLFYSNRLKQGQVTLNTTFPDLADIREFSFSTIPGQFNDPAIAIAKNPQKYLYAKHKGMYIPIEAQYIVTSRESTMRIQAGKDYDQTHKTKTVFLPDKTALTIGELLQIDLNEKENVTTFQIKNSLETNFSIAYEFSKLVVAIAQSDNVRFDGKIIAEEMSNIFKEMLNSNASEYYKTISELGDILNDLGVPLSLFKTKDIIEARNAINALKRALMDKEPVTLPIDNDCGLYYQPLATKKMILEYERLENGKFAIRDFLSDSKRVAVVFEEKDSPVRTSNWLIISPENLSTVIFDHERMVAELKSDLNEIELGHLQNLALAAIAEYDIDKKVKWLEFASNLYDIIADASSEQDDSTIINRAQISYRQSAISESERTALIKVKIQSQSVMAKCCACILLQQHDEFDLLFKNLSDKERETFKTWPVFNLVSD